MLRNVEDVARIQLIPISLIGLYFIKLRSLDCDGQTDQQTPAKYIYIYILEYQDAQMPLFLAHVQASLGALRPFDSSWAL